MRAHPRLPLPAAALLLSLCAAPHALAQEAPQRAPDQRIHYATAENAQGEPVELHLDVFLPVDWTAEDQRPAVVFFFGGGWRSGSPAQFHPFCQHLASLGMVCAAAEYRVESRDGTPPQACVADGRAAVAYLREHAAELGIDPNRIAAGGGSAGGHVAAATGILPGGEAPNVPDALLLYNPVIDTSENGYGQSRLGEHWRALSPLHNVQANQPPTLICHGTADTTTPFSGAEAFRNAMEEAGNACTLVPFEGRNHGFFNSPAFQARRDGVDYAAVIEATEGFLAELGWVEGQDG